MLASSMLVSAALLPVPVAPQAAAASANANAAADGNASSAAQPGAFARELERASATTADAPGKTGAAARDGNKASAKRGSDSNRTNARPGTNARRDGDRLPAQRTKSTAGNADAEAGKRSGGTENAESAEGAESGEGHARAAGLADAAAAFQDAAKTQSSGSSDGACPAGGEPSPDPATDAATPAPAAAAASDPATATQIKADAMASALQPPPLPAPLPGPGAGPLARAAVAPAVGDASVLSDAARQVERGGANARRAGGARLDDDNAAEAPRRGTMPAAERAGPAAADRCDAASPAAVTPRAVARVDDTAPALTGTARPGPEANANAPTGNTGGASFQAELARQSAALAGASAGPGPPANAEVRLPTPVTAPEFVPRFSAEVAVLARDGVQEARVQLHPAELGPITVQITLEGQGAQVNLAVDNAQTRQLLEQSMPSLAAALRENGLTLTGGGVFEQPRRPRESDPDRAGSATARGNARDDADTPVSIGAASARTLHRQGVVDLYA